MKKPDAKQATQPAISRESCSMQPVMHPADSQGMLKSMMREAVRQELFMFFGNKSSHAAQALSSYKNCHHGEPTCGPQHATASDVQVRPHNSHQDGKENEDAVDCDTSHRHFAKFAVDGFDGSVEIDNPGCGSLNSADFGAFSESLRSKPSSLPMWLRLKANELCKKQEPPRAGALASCIGSHVFEMVVRLVIVLNCAFMLLSANWEVRNPHASSNEAIFACDMLFLGFYTLELALKLFVHRWYFFWNTDAAFNTFDFFLVCFSLADLVATVSFAGSFSLRSLRVLKLNRALRVLRIISQFKQLRAMFACIYDSFKTLAFCMLMMSLVIFVFSLVFVQQLADYFKQLPDDGDPWTSEEPGVVNFLSLFGSVQASMLTLFMSIFGGMDWSVPYDAISECGWICSVLFLVFIAYTHIALINIITGLFVDSAMVNLAPDHEQKSMEHQKREAKMARELERLCFEVDEDRSGKLTRKQFMEGFKLGRIPMMLQLLGLNRDNVKEFFDNLAKSSTDGEVDIQSFVNGCMRLKGTATSFDLQVMHVEMLRLKSLQEREFRSMRGLLGSIENAVRGQRLS